MSEISIPIAFIHNAHTTNSMMNCNGIHMDMKEKREKQQHCMRERPLMDHEY